MFRICQNLSKISHKPTLCWPALHSRARTSFAGVKQHSSSLCLRPRGHGICLILTSESCVVIVIKEVEGIDLRGRAWWRLWIEEPEWSCSSPSSSPNVSQKRHSHVHWRSDCFSHVHSLPLLPSVDAIVIFVVTYGSRDGCSVDRVDSFFLMETWKNMLETCDIHERTIPTGHNPWRWYSQNLLFWALWHVYKQTPRPSQDQSPVFFMHRCYGKIYWTNRLYHCMWYNDT